MRFSSTLFVLVLAVSVAVVAAADSSNSGGRCKRIRAEINLTTGTIDGNFGLDGTVAFAQDGTGSPPPTAPVASNVFSGILTITTAHGTLTMRETGMFSSRTGNPAGSIFASWGEALSGTDRFAGVTGDVFFTGGRVPGGQFLLDVTGELCTP